MTLNYDPIFSLKFYESIQNLESDESKSKTNNNIFEIKNLNKSEDFANIVQPCESKNNERIKELEVAVKAGKGDELMRDCDMTNPRTNNIELDRLKEEKRVYSCSLCLYFDLDSLRFFVMV